MSGIIDDVIEAFGGEPAGGGKYAIRRPLDSCYLALGPTGQATLLIPIASANTVAGRAFEGVTLDFEPRIQFQHETKTWEAPAAVLQCIDDALLPTFAVLCVDIAAKVARASQPAARDVLDALHDWETLLRSQQPLSESDELGLWGELWFLASLGNIDHGMEAWRGPEGFTVDFFSGGLGLEIKTSRQRYRHHVSHDQVAIDREFPVFFVSLWVGTDPTSGRTLGELVEAIDRRISDRPRWEALLLRAGFRRTAANLYVNRYALLESLTCFQERDVPRVRSADAGVRQLRYVVELDPQHAVDEGVWASVLAQFTERRSPAT